MNQSDEDLYDGVQWTNQIHLLTNNLCVEPLLDGNMVFLFLLSVTLFKISL